MAVRHKHLKLEQKKIDRARRLLGTETEQETLERALDIILAEEKIIRAHRRVGGVGGVGDGFGRRGRKDSRAPTSDSSGCGGPRLPVLFPCARSAAPPGP